MFKRIGILKARLSYMLLMINSFAFREELALLESGNTDNIRVFVTDFAREPHLAPRSVGCSFSLILC